MDYSTLLKLRGWGKHCREPLPENSIKGALFPACIPRATAPAHRSIFFTIRFSENKKTHLSFLLSLSLVSLSKRTFWENMGLSSCTSSARQSARCVWRSKV